MIHLVRGNVKIVDSNGTFISATNGLPVTVLNTVPVSISGTVPISVPGTIPVSGTVIISGQDLDDNIRNAKVNRDGQLEVSLPELFTLVNDMLKELKKISLQLTLITEVPIENEDVDV